MVLPILAVMAVTAAAGAYAAYKKGEISKAELERLKKLGADMESKLRAPPGTAEPITLEEYQYAQKYNPQIATFVEENQPELIKEAKSQFEITKQRQGLNEFDRLSRTGEDPIADAQREEALFEADARAKSRQANILRDRANRGLSGSGDELLASLDSSQDAQVSARQASLDAVKQAEARRLGALGNMTGLASQIRGQNLQVEQNNANIMNSFNQRLASAKNLYNQNMANTKNQAEMFNIGNTQRTDDMNTGVANQQRVMDVSRREQAAQAKRDFDNAMASGNYDRASNISNMQANKDREMVKDIAQTATSTVAAGAAMAGANKGAAPSGAGATGNTTNNYYNQSSPQPMQTGETTLGFTEEPIENDTNRTRSLYS